MKKPNGFTNGGVVRDDCVGLQDANAYLAGVDVRITQSQSIHFRQSNFRNSSLAPVDLEISFTRNHYVHPPVRNRAGDFHVL